MSEENFNDLFANKYNTSDKGGLKGAMRRLKTGSRTKRGLKRLKSVIDYYNDFAALDGFNEAQRP